MRILIADNHELFREGLGRLLEQVFPTAEYIYAGAYDAVLEACSGPTPPDLILVDLELAGWPGFAALGRVKARLPTAALVVVAAPESGAAARQALEHGAGGYVPKSSSVPILASALRLVLAGGVYLPHALLGSAGTSGPRPVPSRQGPAVAGPPPRGLLTQRQRDVLACLREGRSNKQIAYELGLSEGTVKIHVTAIFRSFGVRNRTQAVITAAGYAPG